MEIAEVKTKASLIEQKADARIDKLTEITELHIEQLNKNIQTLNESLTEFNKDFKNHFKK